MFLADRDDVAFSTLAYHREQSPQNSFTVLYIGTTDGVLIRAIVGNDTDAEKNEYVDELPIADGKVLKVMELSIEFESVYVGWDNGQYPC